MASEAKIIEYFTESGTDDKALTLRNAEASRKLEIGDDWNKIRVGMLLAFQHDTPQNNISSDADVYIGLINDPANGIGATTPDHFIGYHFAQGSGDTWAHNTGTNPDVYTLTGSSTASRWEHVVNGSVVSSNTAEFNIIHIGDHAAVTKCPILLDFEKGVTNWNLTAWGIEDTSFPYAAQNSTDFTIAQFEELMTASDPSATAAGIDSQGGSGAITLTSPDEATNGTLEYVTVYFKKPTLARLIVSTIYVAKFS